MFESQTLARLSKDPVTILSLHQRTQIWSNRAGEARQDLPKRIIEGHGVDDVAVSFEGEQLLSRVCVPDLARAIVAASDKFLACFVEGAIRKGQHM